MGTVGVTVLVVQWDPICILNDLSGSRTIMNTLANLSLISPSLCSPSCCLHRQSVRRQGSSSPATLRSFMQITQKKPISKSVVGTPSSCPQPVTLCPVSWAFVRSRELFASKEKAARGFLAKCLSHYHPGYEFLNSVLSHNSSRYTFGVLC